MAKDREAIFKELCTALETLAPQVHVTRREFPIDSCPSYPTLMVLEGNENPEQSPAGAPPIWTLEAMLIYVGKADSLDDGAPMASVHVFLDALEAALRPPAGQMFNLNKTCQRCWISGPITKLPPMSDEPWTVAMISLEILVPG